MNEYSGSCLCGEIKYKVKKPIKFVVHDHCSICRRAHGAAFVTWCGVSSESEQFELLAGAQSLQSYKFSESSDRQFCKICGSQLFFRSTRWPSEVHFTRASIHQEMTELPKAHVFFSDKANWFDLKHDLPKFGGSTGMEPLD